MTRALLLAALVLLPGAVRANDVSTPVNRTTWDTRETEVRLLGQDGTTLVPTSLLEQRPTWAARYTPMVDMQGKLWLILNTPDFVVWTQPNAWRAFTVQSGRNFGVNLGVSSQAPGTLVTNDAAFGQKYGATLGDNVTTAGDECRPLLPSLPSLPSFDLGSLLLTVAIVVGALIVVLGGRKPR